MRLLHNDIMNAHAMVNSPSRPNRASKDHFNFRKLHTVRRSEKVVDGSEADVPLARLKKRLGYRQADCRGGEPLTPDEPRWFRSTVQRIAAILAIGPRLADLYSAASEDASAAAELWIER